MLYPTLLKNTFNHHETKQKQLANLFFPWVCYYSFKWWLGPISPCRCIQIAILHDINISLLSIIVKHKKRLFLSHFLLFCESDIQIIHHLISNIVILQIIRLTMNNWTSPVDASGISTGVKKRACAVRHRPWITFITSSPRNPLIYWFS